METVRLRKMQQPSQVERLLEALISRGNLLPKECYQIRASGALSPQLQRVVERAIEKGHVWACWADSYHTWLFTCEMSLPMSRERGVPVLAVTRIGGQAFVYVAQQGDKGTQARQRAVTLGDTVGNDYALTAGLKPGDKVIVSGTQLLVD